MKKLSDLLKNNGFDLLTSAITSGQFTYAVKTEKRAQRQEAMAAEELRSIEYKELEESVYKSNIQGKASNYEEAAQEVQRLEIAKNKELNPSKKAVYEEEFKRAKEKEKEKLDDFLESVKKNDISEIFTNLFNKYTEFLSHLKIDQLVSLFNLSIDFALFTSCFSLMSLLAGEHFINFFKLEERYPRLAKAIQIKISVNKIYKTSFFIFHFILLIIGILGNVYMFLLHYFV